MNISSMLESINRIDSETSNSINMLDENTRFLFNKLLAEIESFKKALINEQFRQNASRAGYNTEYKAACRLLKNAARDDLHQAWKNEKGHVCACDGFTGIRLTEPKYALPLLDHQAIDLDALFNKTISEISAEEENMPDYSALKTYFKTVTAEFKAKHSSKALSIIKSCHHGLLPIYYRFETNGAYVSVEYLLTAMEIVPDAKSFTTPFVFSPVYLKGENAEAIVLPVRVNADSEYSSRANADSAALRAGTYFSTIPA